MTTKCAHITLAGQFSYIDIVISMSWGYFCSESVRAKIKAYSVLRYLNLTNCNSIGIICLSIKIINLLRLKEEWWFHSEYLPSFWKLSQFFSICCSLLSNTFLMVLFYFISFWFKKQKNHKIFPTYPSGLNTMRNVDLGTSGNLQGYKGKKAICQTLQK